MKNKALIIGGSNGIGLVLSLEISKICQEVIIVDKLSPTIDLPNNISFFHHNLLDRGIDFLDQFEDINYLIITAGFGRIAPYESILEPEIYNSFLVNSISIASIINHYYKRIKGQTNFYCCVMGSIAGLISSPLFALYGSTKAAVCKLIESLNIELECSQSPNRILNVSPGSIKGTKFNGANNTNIELLKPLALSILNQMNERKTLFIPDYETTFKEVIHKYNTNSYQFGLDSYRYKLESGRLNLKPQMRIGYLSGTFDLFHIGHLNLLRRAKEYCDYLVVGVHKDASHKGKQTFIPFDERMEIVQSIKYVDKVIQSEREDSDVYTKGIIKYDYLFVGSDYQGTERFNRYEEYFKDKGVKIVYFPYTKGTSSTQLREYISIKSKV